MWTVPRPNLQQPPSCLVQWLHRANMWHDIITQDLWEGRRIGGYWFIMAVWIKTGYNRTEIIDEVQTVVDTTMNAVKRQRPVISSRPSIQCYWTDKPAVTRFSVFWDLESLNVLCYLIAHHWPYSLTMKHLFFITIYWCNQTSTNLVFGKLYFTGLQVDADWLATLQLFCCPGKPCVQLIQCVLELTQTQQCTLQLMLKM